MRNLRGTHRSGSELHVRRCADLSDGDGDVRRRRRPALQLGRLLHHRLLCSGAPMTTSQPPAEQELLKALALAFARLLKVP
jgi:hypothetical protein